MDKDWLHFSRFSTEYESGARRFIEIARANSKNADMISCPCTKCRNLHHQNFSTVFEHLVIKGMDPTYTTWVLHGEEPPSASCEQKGVDMTWTHRMYRDAHIDETGDRDAVMDETGDVLEDTNKIKEPDFMHELEMHIMKVDAYQYPMSKMGKSLRDERSNLTRAIRKPKKGQIEESIRPSYVSLDHWKQFVLHRKSKQFKDKSDKMKDVRSHQKIVHRTSRKGFARLEHELKQKGTAEDPPVDRVTVWKKGYAPDDKPVSDQVAKYIEQIDQYSQSPEGQNPTGIDDDALTHVFGRERPGRVRGMGFGVIPSMVRATIQSNRTNQGMRDEIQELKQQVSGLGDLAERLKVMEAALANAGIQLGQTQSSTMPNANSSGQAQ